MAHSVSVRSTKMIVTLRRNNWYPDRGKIKGIKLMTFRVIERYGIARQYSWHVTLHHTLEAARRAAAASAVDFLIEDDCGRPVEYRIG
jgi:hypothetical protein